MGDNDERNEIDGYFDEESVDDFDENGFDPTKEAFFSDLMEGEEEIASEGYELVEHAISLINSAAPKTSISPSKSKSLRQIWRHP